MILPDLFINGASVCGGLIRDHHGCFIKDFWVSRFSKLSLCILRLEILECIPRQSLMFDSFQYQFEWVSLRF